MQCICVCTICLRYLNEVFNHLCTCPYIKEQSWCSHKLLLHVIAEVMSRSPHLLLGREVMEFAVLHSVEYGGDTDVPSTCSPMVKVSLSPFCGGTVKPLLLSYQEPGEVGCPSGPAIVCHSSRQLWAQ